MDQSLQTTFKSILVNESFKPFTVEIAKLIADDSLNPQSLAAVLASNHIYDISDIKTDLIDLLLEYIRQIMSDYQITDDELFNVRSLKRYFKIDEGDIKKYRAGTVTKLLIPQFQKIYSKNKLDEDDAIYNTKLQELFDLGYDDFDKMKEEFILQAIDRGANISDLDTALNTNKVQTKIVATRKKLLEKFDNSIQDVSKFKNVDD